MLLGLNERSDDRVIDDRAGADLQAVILKIPTDQRARPVSPVVHLQQPAEVADDGLARRALQAFALGITRRYRAAKSLPGNDLVHLLKKSFAAGRLAVLLEAFSGERALAHSWTLPET